MNIKQTKFLSAYLQCGNITQASKEAGFSESTGRRLVHDPEFTEELKKQKTAMMNDVSVAMQAGFMDAVDRLNKIIKSRKSSAQVKINAIDCLFRNARALTEDVDILKRLEEVEKVNAERADDER